VPTTVVGLVTSASWMGAAQTGPAGAPPVPPAPPVAPELLEVAPDEVLDDADAPPLPVEDDDAPPEPGAAMPELHATVVRASEKTAIEEGVRTARW
jgi:hypothetical protein